VEGPETFRRRLLILQALSLHGSEGRTVRQLADETAVNEKTIRRDLGLLKSLDCGLEEIVGKQNLKIWRIPAPLAGLSALKFNYLEAVALFLAHRLLDPLAGTELWNESRSAIRKIRLHLDAGALKLIDRIAHGFHFTTGGQASYTAQAQNIDDLQLAVEDRKVVFMSYQSQRATEPVTYEINPLGLVYHHRALYLIAFVPESSRIKHYKINRVSTVDVQTLRFQPPAGFNLADHLKGSFGIYLDDGETAQTVRLCFTRDAARYVQEHRWHETQTFDTQPDGSLLVTFVLSDLTEITTWILSFGGKATVLEPLKLKGSVLTAARAIVEAEESTLTQKPP